MQCLVVLQPAVVVPIITTDILRTYVLVVVGHEKNKVIILDLWFIAFLSICEFD